MDEKGSMSNSISVKGTRDGLTITIGSGEFAALTEELAAHLTTQGAFFRGGKVALRLGGRALSEEDIRYLSELLGRHDMTLRTIVTQDQETAAAAERLGLHVAGDTPRNASETATPARSPQITRTPDIQRGLFLKRQVRSGQVVRHPGPVVIVGDVNSGAEIWAGSDVIVWGRLYGVVRAGSTGNDQAVVCALELRPAQLRIADYAAQLEPRGRQGRQRPQIARVRDGAVVIQPWDTRRRGV